MDVVTAPEVEELFGGKPGLAAKLCKEGGAEPDAIFVIMGCHSAHIRGLALVEIENYLLSLLHDDEHFFKTKRGELILI